MSFKNEARAERDRNQSISEIERAKIIKNSGDHDCGSSSKETESKIKTVLLILILNTIYYY